MDPNLHDSNETSTVIQRYCPKVPAPPDNSWDSYLEQCSGTYEKELQERFRLHYAGKIVNWVGIVTNIGEDFVEVQMDPTESSTDEGDLKIFVSPQIFEIYDGSLSLHNPLMFVASLETIDTNQKHTLIAQNPFDTSCVDQNLTWPVFLQFFGVNAQSLADKNFITHWFGKQFEYQGVLLTHFEISRADSRFKSATFLPDSSNEDDTEPAHLHIPCRSRHFRTCPTWKPGVRIHAVVKFQSRTPEHVLDVCDVIIANQPRGFMDAISERTKEWMKRPSTFTPWSPLNKAPLSRQRNGHEITPEPTTRFHDTSSDRPKRPSRPAPPLPPHMFRNQHTHPSPVTTTVSVSSSSQVSPIVQTTTSTYTALPPPPDTPPTHPPTPHDCTHSTTPAEQTPSLLLSKEELPSVALSTLSISSLPSPTLNPPLSIPVTLVRPPQPSFTSDDSSISTLDSLPPAFIEPTLPLPTKQPDTPLVREYTHDLAQAYLPPPSPPALHPIPVILCSPPAASPPTDTRPSSFFHVQSPPPLQQGVTEQQSFEPYLELSDPSVPTDTSFNFSDDAFDLMGDSGQVFSIPERTINLEIPIDLSFG
ncbi:hypothetical protein BLNAU_5669 [Blattamonas nauphoetae]|uniref:Uncharacterized protein n=1 Tax=Blattamonas nauphoetae TaxID=2049346 RepID=A0ABQ9Y6N8_9EUKA|nr:hypothetical protein BLNAU_5669 [Blattamonas nauphoetae]